MNFSAIERSLPGEALVTAPRLPFPHIGSGKVREIYDLGEELLIVATDRISAFDVILPNGVPGKGVLLTQISLFWFRLTESIAPNHLVPDQDRRLRNDLCLPEELAVRSMLVRKLRPLPVECVVRGYLAGSGWQSYRTDRLVCGHRLPDGLRESEKLPTPLFTPTTKATSGHDQPITEAECAELLGIGLFEQVKSRSLSLYSLGRERSARAGMILADTKFEFGLDPGGNIFLIDEVMTPDSSRYWPAEGYQPGKPQPGFDKQYVRDFLLRCGWNMQPPAPVLPSDVIEGTRERYAQALRNLARAGFPG